MTHIATLSALNIVITYIVLGILDAAVTHPELWSAVCYAHRDLKASMEREEFVALEIAALSIVNEARGLPSDEECEEDDFTFPEYDDQYFYDHGLGYGEEECSEQFTTTWEEPEYTYDPVEVAELEPWSIEAQMSDYVYFMLRGECAKALVVRNRMRGLFPESFDGENFTPNALELYGVFVDHHTH